MSTFDKAWKILKNDTLYSCPACGYEPPQNYNLGDAYCYDCETIVPESEVSQCQRDGHDLDIMDEEGLRSEAEFWLYENHPDFCPMGWNPDEEGGVQ